MWIARYANPWQDIVGSEKTIKSASLLSKNAIKFKNWFQICTEKWYISNFKRSFMLVTAYLIIHHCKQITSDGRLIMDDFWQFLYAHSNIKYANIKPYNSLFQLDLMKI